ncbi:MAG TPA: hypothetical protein VGM37_20970 [Armatimonadota bacterium]|jgi:hypothetical protein
MMDVKTAAIIGSVAVGALGAAIAARRGVAGGRVVVAGVVLATAAVLGMFASCGFAQPERRYIGQCGTWLLLASFGVMFVGGQKRHFERLRAQWESGGVAGVRAVMKESTSWPVWLIFIGFSALGHVVDQPSFYKWLATDGPGLVAILLLFIALQIVDVQLVRRWNQERPAHELTG